MITTQLLALSILISMILTNTEHVFPEARNLTISLPITSSKVVGKVMAWLPLTWVARDTVVGGRPLISMKNKISSSKGKS